MVVLKLVSVLMPSTRSLNVLTKLLSCWSMPLGSLVMFSWTGEELVPSRLSVTPWMTPVIWLLLEVMSRGWWRRAAEEYGGVLGADKVVSAEVGGAGVEDDLAGGAGIVGG